MAEHISTLQATRKAGHALPDNGDHLRPRESSICLVQTPDKEPLLGLSYQCDFRAEEEWGVGALRKALASVADPDLPLSALMQSEGSRGSASGIVHERGNLVAFTTRGEPSSSEWAEAKRYIEHAEPYAQGLSSDWSWQHRTVADLRKAVEQTSLKPPARDTKNLLIALLRAQEVPSTPHLHAGWFATGRALVLRRDDTAYGFVLDRLVKAAREGALVTGNNGVTVFGSGLSLFDSRDFGPETIASIASITEAHRLHRERMEAFLHVQH